MLSRCIYGYRHHAPVDRQMIGDVREKSPRHNDIEKNVNACIKIPPDVSSPRTIGDISPSSAEQHTTGDEHSARYTKVQNVADSAATHRLCSQHARVNIGDVYSM